MCFFILNFNIEFISFFDKDVDRVFVLLDDMIFIKVCVNVIIKKLLINLCRFIDKI